MGIDTYLFLEYRSGTLWLNAGKFLLPPNSDLRAALEDCGDKVPGDIASETKEEFLFCVTENPENDNECSYETARELVEYGASYWWQHGCDLQITKPDINNPRCLSLSRFKGTIYPFSNIQDMAVYICNAVMVAMERVEEQGLETRVVYWFSG